MSQLYSYYYIFFIQHQIPTDIALYASEYIFRDVQLITIGKFANDAKEF